MTNSKAALGIEQLVPDILNICIYEGKRNFKKKIKKEKMHKEYQLGHIS